MKKFALLLASKEIREWCSILEQGIMRWTGVKMIYIFGTRAFYDRKTMFAMLPDRRSLDSSTAISFREAFDHAQGLADLSETRPLTSQEELEFLKAWFGPDADFSD
jgi:hypothetical protein